MPCELWPSRGGCFCPKLAGYRVLYSTGRCYVATHILQIVIVSEGRSDNQVDFCASLHSHTTWGGDTPGGWGRTRGLGPPGSPPRDPRWTRGGPRAGATMRPRNRAITLTTQFLGHNGYKPHTVADVSLIRYEMTCIFQSKNKQVIVYGLGLEFRRLVAPGRRLRW
jgi:hypothetical protein